MSLEQDKKDLQEEEFEEEEILDPGLKEGEKKPVKENEPPVDHPRFKQIYGKLKHTERELEDIKKSAANKTEAFNLLKKHNEELSESVEKAMKTVEESMSKKQEQQVDEIDKKIETLEEDVAVAIGEDDLKTAMKLQGQINKLQIKKIKVPDSNEIAVKVKELIGNVAAPQAENIDFKIWVKENPWYDKDPIMRGAADAFGLSIKDKGLGYTDLLAEVTKEISKRFGTGKKDNPRKQFKSVETSDETNLDVETDSASEEEVKIAKLFDMKVEDYRKQKKFASKNRGE